MNKKRQSTDSGLEIRLKLLKSGYKEIGKIGGIFRSPDGLRQVRIDPISSQGSHKPNVPHVHFEIFEKNAKYPHTNNHVSFYD